MTSARVSSVKLGRIAATLHQTTRRLVVSKLPFASARGCSQAYQGIAHSGQLESLVLLHIPSPSSTRLGMSASVAVSYGDEEGHKTPSKRG